jgi:hypothetical protein
MKTHVNGGSIAGLIGASREFVETQKRGQRRSGVDTGAVHFLI